MSHGKSFIIINPGCIPIGSSLLFFVLSFFTIPFLIGFILVPIAGMYLIYQVIHWEKHWIHISRSKISIHYLLSTVTISREEFTGVSLSAAQTGGNSILILHTGIRRYRFGRVDNPRYVSDIFQQFKDGTLFPGTSAGDDFSCDSEQKISGQFPSQMSSDTASYSTSNQLPVLNDKEWKGKVLETALRDFLFSSGKIPGYHRELCNLYVPSWNNYRTEIDVVMIHEAGIYVFECKNYGGSVFGSTYDDRWTVVYPNKEKYSVHNPILQNDGHINALADFLGMRYENFYSYIVFGRDAYLSKVPDDSNLCIISDYYCLEEKLLNHIQLFTGVFSPDSVDEIYEMLQPLTTPSNGVKAEHNLMVSEIQRGVV